jgi:hypothetical protein
MRRVSILLVLALAIIGLGSGCKPPNHGQTPATPVAWEHLDGGFGR